MTEFGYLYRLSGLQMKKNVSIASIDLLIRQLYTSDFAPTAQFAAIVYDDTVKQYDAPGEYTLEIYDYLLQHSAHVDIANATFTKPGVPVYNIFYCRHSEERATALDNMYRKLP